MKRTVKYLTDTRVVLTINLDAKELEAADQVALVKLARNVKVSGFRKGKAPLTVARKSIDPNALQDEVLNSAISKAVAEGFTDEGLQALDRPEVEVKKFVPGQQLEFTAETEVIPPIKLGDHTKLKARREKLAVSTEETEEIIDRMRESFAARDEVTRPVKKGDEVTIDFTGMKDDQAFDGGSAKDYILKIGAGQFIPGFEDGIIGHKAGDKFELDLKFPKDYPSRDLAGQAVVFKVSLTKVSELTLPELNDEFAAKNGPFTDMKELRDDIEREILAKKNRDDEERFKDELVSELAQGSKVSLPEILVNDQMRSLEQDMTQNLQYRGATLDDYLTTQKFANKEDWLSKEVRPAAEMRVKAGLVIAELSKVMKIEITHAELSEQISQMKTQYGAQDAAIAKQFEDPAVHRDIANRMVADKTINKLAELYS